MARRLLPPVEAPARPAPPPELLALWVEDWTEPHEREQQHGPGLDPWVPTMVLAFTRQQRARLAWLAEYDVPRTERAAVFPPARPRFRTPPATHLEP